MSRIALAIVVFVVLTGLANLPAAEPEAAPKAVPSTRVSMKLALESLKSREPRLPLPPPVTGQAWNANNGTMRRHYLPASWYAADFARDPVMTLEDAFKVRLFWIVSRANNCQYCLGHQEHKLLKAGMTEDRIAALDCAWEQFPASEQAAMAFTQKLTLTPHLLANEDRTSLAAFRGAELVELLHAASFFNSVNRWTDGLGLPQDETFRSEALHLTTPASPEYQNRPTRVVAPTDEPRPAWESVEVVARLQQTAVMRVLPAGIPQEAAARLALGEPALPSGAMPSWARALAHFPTAGGKHIRALLAVQNEGRLPVMLKAQVAYACARDNRAWTAIALAEQRLTRLGGDGAAVTKLALAATPAADDEPTWYALQFARKLTVAPKAICDADIARLRTHFSDHEVAELVYVICTANFFDRFTEALLLPADGDW